MTTNTLIGHRVLVKTDYMEEPVVGVIKRIRIEVQTADGKETLVSARNITDFVVLGD